MAQQDTLQRSKERYQDALDEMQETHARVLEDLRFSNPAAPEQWPAEMLRARGARPAYTFDRCNQFIQQVVNDARQNKPSIEVLPADSVADPAVAEQLGGMIRHIEYVSRAGIAYDTAIELSARCGLGWLRVVPQIMRPETNEQEVRILRVHDPLSCMLEAGWTQPDGSDAMVGWATTMMPRRAFKARWPKASATADWEDRGGIWTQAQSDLIRVAEEFEILESSRNRLEIALPDGMTQTLAEDDYWTTAASLGYQPQVTRQFEATERKVKWRHLSGAEVLEETDFPSQFLPVIPVLGFELWVEGKRYLCGLTRRLMDGQRLHNYEMTALAETLATQPKAPFLVSGRAIEGHEDRWQRLNTGNPAFLTYNDVDSDGQTPIAPPTRLGAPTFPTGFAQAAVLAGQEMEAAVGMYKANLGQQGNETSGRAINARRAEGDTATFHFIDNLARSIEQLGRVVVDMIPRIYDTPRRARVLGINGEQSFVQLNPEMQGAARRDGDAVVEINPGAGAYDIRVKVGPAYSTQRQEIAQQLTELVRSTPQLMPVLGPMWARMQDFPEADKLAKVLLTMAPPQVQALETGEQQQPQIPPEVQQQMQQMQGVIQQLQQQLQAAGNDLQKAEIQARTQIEVAHINANARNDVEELKGMVALLLQQMQPPPALTAQALTKGPTEGPSSFPPPGSDAAGDQVTSDPNPPAAGQQSWQ